LTPNVFLFIIVYSNHSVFDHDTSIYICTAASTDGLPQSRQILPLAIRQKICEKGKTFRRPSAWAIKKGEEKERKKEKKESNFLRPNPLGGRRPSTLRSSQGIWCPLLGGRVVVVVSGDAVTRSTQWCVSPVGVV